MTTKADIAWAAGLVCGEGSVFITRVKKGDTTYRYLRLTVEMYDERAVRRFVEITGSGYFQTVLRRHNDHVLHRAISTGQSAVRILTMLWPYLRDTDKGDQAARRAEELGLTDFQAYRTLP